MMIQINVLRKQSKVLRIELMESKECKNTDTGV